MGISTPKREVLPFRQVTMPREFSEMCAPSPVMRVSGINSGDFYTFKKAFQ